MKVISFFNHKGGVSKTTTAYHVAWMLSDKGYRVLMVDTDSQCNLTLTAIGEDNYEAFQTANPDNNIKSCLDTAFYSKPKLIEAPDCVKVKGKENLILLPGNFDITEFEVQLGISFQLSGSFSIMNSLPGSFYYLFEKCAEKFNIDYVIVDLNPSLSAINQALISSSDFFVLPSSPDYFSNMAIKSMSRIFPQWEEWALQARRTFKNSTYPMPQLKPKFIGYSINDFNIRNDQPTAAFAQIMANIDDTINDTLYPSLHSMGMTIDRGNYESGSLCLAKISNFQHLQAKYQEYGVPVFALTEAQIGTTGIVLEGHLQKQAAFRQVYTHFADEIIRLAAI